MSTMVHTYCQKQHDFCGGEGRGDYFLYFFFFLVFDPQSNICHSQRFEVLGHNCGICDV